MKGSIIRVGQVHDSERVKIKRGTLAEEFLYQFFLFESFACMKAEFAHEAKLMNPHAKLSEEFINS